MKKTLLICAALISLSGAASAEEAPCNLTEEEFYGWFSEEIVGEWNINYKGGLMTFKGRTLPVQAWPSDTLTLFKADGEIIGEDMRGRSVAMDFVSDQRWKFGPKDEDDPMIISDEDMSLAAGCGDGLLPQLHYQGSFSKDGGTFDYDAYLIFGSTGFFTGILKGTITTPKGSGTLKQSFSGRQAM